MFEKLVKMQNEAKIYRQEEKTEIKKVQILEIDVKIDQKVSIYQITKKK